MRFDEAVRFGVEDATASSSVVRLHGVSGIDFSAPLVAHARETSPGAGRPGGVLFDDLFETFETGDPDLPVCVRGRGVGEVEGYGELELSLMHSKMPLYKSASTCVGYARGQRLFYSAPTVQRLKREGLLSFEGSLEQGRLLVAQMLEQDLGCKLSPADNRSAFYVDPRAQEPTAVKRILYGMSVGIAIQQAFDIFPHANPLLQDHLPPAVRFAALGKFGTDMSQDELRKLLYQVPRFFIVTGDKWPSVGRVCPTPMRVAYKAALLADWQPGHLWMLRVLIESGARLSEVVALTILDWIECSGLGTRCNAINKGSRGTVWKEIGFTASCAQDGIDFINDHRVSPIEFKRHGRRLKVEDYLQLYQDGRIDELRVPIVTTRVGGHYTRDGFYNHTFSPTMSELGILGHDPRREFVSRNLDQIHAKYWQDDVLLKTACEKLIEYMAWTAGELMLFLYSKRHRQRRSALLAASFHHVMQLDEVQAQLPDATKLLGRTPLPEFYTPNAVDRAFDEMMEGIA